MDEKVVVEDVKVEVKEKKKISKKILAIGGGILLALGIGAVVLLTRGNNEGEGQEILKALETDYEPVTNSEISE